MKTELPQDSPVCFHDFSVADESIAWSSCSSAGLASSSIHGAKLTLSLESTSFRLHNVALRFGIYTFFWNLFQSWKSPTKPAYPQLLVFLIDSNTPLLDFFDVFRIAWVDIIFRQGRHYDLCPWTDAVRMSQYRRILLIYYRP